ncbi:hypothetical protein [Polaromonas sp. CG_23.6]|uniref:hypothetical protein n=1 Tax=Polaromonas sp. CG_23.6 TaxID=2760709 RepID=UPI002475BECB|nr:hypothetical protein [Polaromonas sp. CG_23.6]MDH6185516.1 hypothetical protein [Polaromonas sp. CG_23.6]
MNAQRLAWQALPKFWRPKLAPSRQILCQVIHWDLITAFTNGTATAETLWDWIETGFTYTQMMRLLIADGLDFTDDAIHAMNQQIECYEGVIARLRTTGRAGFNAQELAIARAAASVMDSLIELDRHGIADAAGRWSVEQMRALRTTGRLPANQNKKRKKS